MEKINVGFAITGSFCTFKRAIETMKELKEAGYNIVPIMSYNAYSTDTRFGKASEFREAIEIIAGRHIISNISDAEPIGPKKMLDILIIEPCTGNTLAKLANSIADTPVTLAAKSHLRNGRPVLLAISTNDALAGASKNIGALLNYKNLYFIPYKQDDSENKPTSIVAEFSLTERAMLAALNGKQLQPLIL